MISKAKDLMAYRNALEAAKDEIYRLSERRFRILSWMLFAEDYWLCVGQTLARIESLVCADPTVAQR